MKQQIDLLIGNLSEFPPPLTLISQYLPAEYEAIREGRLQASAGDMVRHHIQGVLHKYSVACGERNIKR